MTKYILGISAYYHDSAAAILADGEIIAAAQEERFTRKKHDPAFPIQAIKYVLEEAGVDPADIKHVAFYEKPYLKFERLLETYHAFAPVGLSSFYKAIPVWIREKLFMKQIMRKDLKELGLHDFEMYFPEHHLSHAASAHYSSPFEETAILTLDGVGEWATTTLSHGVGKDITVLKQIDFPHSLGLLYSACTYYCGFKVNSGEYKLMGLAPYGNMDSPDTKQYIEKIQSDLIDIRPDGSFVLNMSYFKYATGLRMTCDKKWGALFGLKRRIAEQELTQDYMNFALAIQMVTEDIVLKLARSAKELTGAKYLTMAGGVALNCVANGKITQEKIFDEIWIQPAAGDAGGALGAAQAVDHIVFGREHKPVSQKDKMQGAYLGPAFSEIDIERSIRKYDAVSHKYAQSEGLSEDVSALLDQGNVIGWFQGRMEFGPRALGNRSILGDARNPEMQKKLNLKIKYREGFRPFAPAVLAEDLEELFDINQVSPYMLMVAPVQKTHQVKMPDDYHQLPLYERLYHLRSDIPAVTHVDFSARIQTVHEDTNPEFHDLLKKFKAKTGYGVLVNTSFNVRGEPVVCTPEDAYRCFMRTEMDYLVINNYLFKKQEQPSWECVDDWQEEFVLD